MPPPLPPLQEGSTEPVHVLREVAELRREVERMRERRSAQPQPESVDVPWSHGIEGSPPSYNALTFSG